MDTKELLTKISDLLEKVGVKAALKNPEVIDTIYNVMTKHGMKVDKALFSIVMFGIANSEKIDIGALLNLGSGLLGGAQQGAQPSAQQNSAANAANALGALGALAGAMGGAQQANAQPSNNAANAANMLGALGALSAMAGAMGGAQQGAQTSAQQSAQPQQPNVGDAINAIAGIANALGNAKK